MRGLSYTSLILLMILVVACGGGEGEETAVSHTSQSSGLTFTHPPDWQIKELGRELILASNETVLTEQDYTEAAAIIFFVEPLSEVSPDLKNFITKDIVGDQMAYVVERPATTTINGLEAATVLMERPRGELTLFSGTTLIRKDDQVAFILTVYDSTQEDTFAPIVQEIVESVQFLND